MKAKKNKRFFEIRVSSFSLIGLVLCWVGITLISFYLGFNFGLRSEQRIVKKDLQVYERVGDSEQPPDFSFPEVLGDSGQQNEELVLFDDNMNELAIKTSKGKLKLPSEKKKQLKPPRGKKKTVKPEKVSHLKPVIIEQEKRKDVKERLLQIASFRKRESAENLVNELREKGYPSFFTESIHPGTRQSLCRVFVGPYTSLDKAVRVKARLEDRERFKDIFIRSGTL